MNIKVLLFLFAFSVPYVSEVNAKKANPPCKEITTDGWDLVTQRQACGNKNKAHAGRVDHKQTRHFIYKHKKSNKKFEIMFRPSNDAVSGMREEYFNKIIECEVKGPFHRGADLDNGRRPRFASVGACQNWCSKDGFNRCKDKCRDKGKRKCNKKNANGEFRLSAKKRKKCEKEHYQTRCKDRNKFCRDTWKESCKQKCKHKRVQLSGKAMKSGKSWQFKDVGKLVPSKDFEMKCDSGIKL